MNIFVLNCGSSSAKFQVIDVENEHVLGKGIVEKIGSTRGILKFEPEGRNRIQDIRDVPDHLEAIHLVTKTITHPQYGIIPSLDEIDAVGHRVVHGGESFSESVIATEKVLKEVERCSEFAPLHNPGNLKGIRVCEEVFPNLKQVCVFDTAFHQTIPPEAYIYPLPYKFYKNYVIRRYGFHGTSHKYVTLKCAELLKRDLSDLKIITCHLGNGASLAAVSGGKSIDTSMGFTPLEGLMMGTRCGDVDPAIITYIIDREGLDSSAVNTIMNKYSGFLGVTEDTNDLRDIEERVSSGSEIHLLAHKIFCLRIKKYIGAYAAEMGGLDAIIFTGGIGENSVMVRESVCSGLKFLGVEIDGKKNKKNETHLGRGKVEVMVIPTNEELMIAHDTYDLVKTAEKAEADLAELRPTLTDADRVKIVSIWSRYRHNPEALIEEINKNISKEIDMDTLTAELKEVGLV